jgi:hypothetical protein
MRRVNIRLAGLGCLLAVAGLAQTVGAQICESLTDCYAQSIELESESMFILYSRPSPTYEWRKDAIRCKSGSTGKCEIFQSERNTSVLTNFEWGYNADLKEAQGLAIDPGLKPVAKIKGYATLPSGAESTVNYDLALYGGVTIEATAYVTPKVEDIPLLEMKDGSRSVVFIWWKRGQLEVRRMATTAEQVQSDDLPWDMDFKTIASGVSPFQHEMDKYSGIVEFYFTFTSDGKLKIDMFTVNSEVDDQLITHLQDMGLPVQEYPKQSPSATSWLPPKYQAFDKVVVWSVEGEEDSNILQVVVFREPLSDNEILAFHTKNAFFGKTAKSPVKRIALFQQPCNSGNYMNIPPSEHIDTVCGARLGQGGTALQVSGADDDGP